MYTLKSLGIKTTLELKNRQVNGDSIIFFTSGLKVTCKLRDFVYNSLQAVVNSIE